MPIFSLDNGDSTWNIAAKILQSLPSLTGGGGAGVTGPGVSVNNDVVVFNGTTGQIIKDSGVALSSVNTTTQVTNQTPTGTVNGVNATFTLANTPILGTEMIFLNGLLQIPTTDYTMAGSVITMIPAPVTGGVIRATYLK